MFTFQIFHQWSQIENEILIHGCKGILKNVIDLTTENPLVIQIHYLLVLSHLKLAMSVWEGAIQKQNVQDIKKMQRTTFCIIFTNFNFTYWKALTDLNEKTLKKETNLA